MQIRPGSGQTSRVRCRCRRRGRGRREREAGGRLRGTGGPRPRLRIPSVVALPRRPIGPEGHGDLHWANGSKTDVTRSDDAVAIIPLLEEAGVTQQEVAKGAEGDVTDVEEECTGRVAVDTDETDVLTGGSP